MSRAYDPDDPDQISERQADAERARQQTEADWAWLLAAPQGRRVVAELLAACGLMQPSFSDAVLLMARAEGRRSIGLQIYARITQSGEGTHLPAILAEVSPPDVRRARSANQRNAAGRSSG